MYVDAIGWHEKYGHVGVTSKSMLGGIMHQFLVAVITW